MEQYTVTTSIGTYIPVVREALEELVRRRSRIESHGYALFSLMLLQRFESGQTISVPFVSQAAISACMWAVDIRDSTDNRPQPSDSQSEALTFFAYM